MRSILIFVILFLMIGIGAPIAFSLLAASLFFGVLVAGMPFESLIQRVVGGLNSFPLLAIPFFLLAGEIMEKGGITIRIFRFANSLVGHIRGGLAHVMVVVSMIFAGMCGSSMAETSGLCKVGLEGMLRGGYSRGFVAALSATAATIGPIIPPSIPFVIYGGLTGVSIGRLFLAGAIPGVCMGFMLMAVILILSKKHNYHSQPRASFQEFRASLKSAVFPLFFPIIIVGGILIGVFTPTEAAAVAVAYAILVSGLIYRELPLSDIPRSFVDIGLRSASILFIVAAATPFGYLMTWSQIPQKLTLFFTSLSESPLVFLTIINIFVILLGCFMEGLTILIILIPILQPMILAYNIDPVHFGVILNLSTAIGLTTPPFGMNMFITTAIAEVSIKQYTKEALPFIIVLIIALFLFTYVPSISLFLPNLLMGPSR